VAPFLRKGNQLENVNQLLNYLKSNNFHEIFRQVGDETPGAMKTIVAPDEVQSIEIINETWFKEGCVVRLM
jgi:hypothetical protein